MTFPALAIRLTGRLAAAVARSIFRPVPSYQWAQGANAMPANDDHDRDHRSDDDHRRDPAGITDDDLARAERYGFLAIPEGQPCPARWKASCRARDSACVVLHQDPDAGHSRLTADFHLCSWTPSRSELAAAVNATGAAWVEQGPGNFRAHGIPPSLGRAGAWYVAEALSLARTRAHSRLSPA